MEDIEVLSSRDIAVYQYTFQIRESHLVYYIFRYFLIPWLTYRSYFSYFFVFFLLKRFVDEGSLSSQITFPCLLNVVFQ